MIVSRVGKLMNLNMGLLNHHVVLRHLISVRLLFRLSSLKIPTEHCLLLPVFKAFSFIYGTAVVSVCTEIYLPREEVF